MQEHKLSIENLNFLLGSEEFIPAGNEPSAVLARAFMTIELVLLYGECREGQIPRCLQRCKFATPLLAAGYLIDANNEPGSHDGGYYLWLFSASVGWISASDGIAGWVCPHKRGNAPPS